ncbi:MAG TPA: TMEM175 family protein [Pseudonocardiaceae bacterium]|nr:TMEM175 family protein [Pseudonocardiaceae bacterium]
MTAPAEETADERATGRLFGLSDAVFAIAMTLLALDLRVPDLGPHPGDAALVRALLDQGPHYLAFLISFYVIAVYWMRHNAEMRTVHASHPALLRRTITLLLMVCTLPFAADLLGTYGGQDGIAIAVYAGINLLAVGSLLMIRYEARHHRLTTDTAPASGNLELWFDLVGLALAIPSGYLFPSRGLLVMVGLMVLSGALGSIVTRRRDQRTRASSAADAGVEQD